MAATLYLLGCLLIPGQTMARPQSPRGAAPARVQSTASGDWLLVPHLRRSQELVYRGTFHEEGHGGRVQFSRSYRLETRILVLETPPKGAEIAVLATLRHRPSSGSPPLSSDMTPTSIRLERARVDLQGKVTADAGVDLLTPLDGAPALECAAFVALPGGHVHVGQEWLAVEGDRPPLTWQAVGAEMVGGNSCIKLVGEQKSDDWDRPRADRTAWRRQDTVWLVPQRGLVYRLEREIQRREPAQREATQRSVLRVEMESNFQLSGYADDSRRREIAQALTFRDNLRPLLAQPARYEQRLTALLKKIDYHLENQPETPYRPAVYQIKRRAEAAKRGETPPEPIHETKTAPAVATLGQLAPDFTVSNFTGGGSAQLRRYAGKPIVLVFYHPKSATTPAVLRYAQKLLADYPQRIAVLGLCVADDAETARRQHSEMGLKFPLLCGGGLRASFGVESTPKIVLLDGSNIVRGEYLGWGQETPREVVEELKHWLPAGVAVPSAPAPQR
ncbi:MAG TPA: redoxin domain-containing protein [Gemmataceae bacterium]|jgi:peroxiredoxin